MLNQKEDILEEILFKLLIKAKAMGFKKFNPVNLLY